LKIKKLLFLSLLIGCFFLFSDKDIVANNISGLHLTQPQDIYKAKDIINSSNGDWGWATIVVRTNQLNRQMWQDFFDNCRKFHIIPIIRIATIPEDDHWKRPSESNIDSLANFLNSLNWPTEQQHVILFNEVNHASEWGGEMDVKSFVDISIYAYQKFKSINQNFIILSSAFDLAAPEKLPETKSASDFYREIFAYRPEYFDNIDALSSHSYPNHGFIGTPKDTGQHSILGYKWELDFIKNLGVNKTFPVFITETGWPHREGENKKNNFYTVQTSADFLKIALDMWGSDPNIQAVTPFIYNFPNAPFDHFSWVNKSENLYPEYQEIIDIPKNKNIPTQITKYEVTDFNIPFLIFANTDYSGQITLKNTGQSIWGENETNFCLKPDNSQNIISDSICTVQQKIYPNQTETFTFKFKINSIKKVFENNFLSWENLPKFQIEPLISNTSIYRPKTGLKEKILNYLVNIFKK
jgi:hypothetical protein